MIHCARCGHPLSFHTEFDGALQCDAPGCRVNDCGPAPGYRFGPEDLPVGFDLSEVKDLRQAPWSGPLVPADIRAELERLRAIVRDLAETEPLDTEFNECRLCFGDYDWLEKRCLHEPGCPWLRATQEVQP